MGRSSAVLGIDSLVRGAFAFELVRGGDVEGEGWRRAGAGPLGKLPGVGAVWVVSFDGGWIWVGCLDGRERYNGACACALGRGREVLLGLVGWPILGVVLL